MRHQPFSEQEITSVFAANNCSTAAQLLFLYYLLLYHDLYLTNLRTLGKQRISIIIIKSEISLKTLRNLTCKGEASVCVYVYLHACMHECMHVISLVKEVTLMYVFVCTHACVSQKRMIIKIVQQI